MQFVLLPHVPPQELGSPAVGAGVGVGTEESMIAMVPGTVETNAF